MLIEALLLQYEASGQPEKTDHPQVARYQSQQRNEGESWTLCLPNIHMKLSLSLSLQCRLASRIHLVPSHSYRLNRSSAAPNIKVIKSIGQTDLPSAGQVMAHGGDLVAW